MSSTTIKNKERNTSMINNNNNNDFNNFNFEPIIKHAMSLKSGKKQKNKTVKKRTSSEYNAHLNEYIEKYHKYNNKINKIIDGLKLHNNLLTDMDELELLNIGITNNLLNKILNRLVHISDMNVTYNKDKNLLRKDIKVLFKELHSFYDIIKNLYKMYDIKKLKDRININEFMDNYELLKIFKDVNKLTKENEFIMDLENNNKDIKDFIKLIFGSHIFTTLTKELLLRGDVEINDMINYVNYDTESKRNYKYSISDDLCKPILYKLNELYTKEKYLLHFNKYKKNKNKLLFVSSHGAILNNKIIGSVKREEHIIKVPKKTMVITLTKPDHTIYSGNVTLIQKLINGLNLRNDISRDKFFKLSENDKITKLSKLFEKIENIGLNISDRYDYKKDSIPKLRQKLVKYSKLFRIHKEYELINDMSLNFSNDNYDKYNGHNFEHGIKIIDSKTNLNGNIVDDASFYIENNVRVSFNNMNLSTLLNLYGEGIYIIFACRSYSSETQDYISNNVSNSTSHKNNIICNNDNNNNTLCHVTIKKENNVTNTGVDIKFKKSVLLSLLSKSVNVDKYCKYVYFKNYNNTLNQLVNYCNIRLLISNSFIIMLTILQYIIILLTKTINNVKDINFRRRNKITSETMNNIITIYNKRLYKLAHVITSLKLTYIKFISNSGKIDVRLIMDMISFLNNYYYNKEKYIYRDNLFYNIHNYYNIDKNTKIQHKYTDYYNKINELYNGNNRDKIDIEYAKKQRDEANKNDADLDYLSKIKNKFSDTVLKNMILPFLNVNDENNDFVLSTTNILNFMQYFEKMIYIYIYKHIMTRNINIDIYEFSKNLGLQKGQEYIPNNVNVILNYTKSLRETNINEYEELHMQLLNDITFIKNIEQEFKIIKYKNKKTHHIYYKFYNEKAIHPSYEINYTKKNSQYKTDKYIKIGEFIVSNNSDLEKLLKSDNNLDSEKNIDDIINLEDDLGDITDMTLFNNNEIKTNNTVKKHNAKHYTKNKKSMTNHNTAH